jgi:hypothetical protein
MTTPLIETERFKEGLARLDVELMAARALFEAQVTSAWQRPVKAALTDLAGVAEQLQAAIWVAAACVRVVEGCFELAGSRAVYESSSLQRRVRDVRTGALTRTPRRCAVLNWKVGCFLRYSSPTTSVAIGAARIPGKGLHCGLPFQGDRVKFALDWAQWEPAFVAQQHRDWFS